MPPARDRILAAAERRHARDGIDGLSLRGVAADVGITPMAIYRHFRDKDALIAALVARGFARWETVLARAARARTPRRKIEQALHAYAAFALDEPRLFQLMFLTPRPRVPTVPASLERTASPSFGAILSSIGDRPDSAELAIFAWSAILGIIALHFSGRFGNDDVAFRRAYARLVRRLLSTVLAVP